ncbi:Hypothetical protein R9X50_00457600 [Acrodontium crateriforme]|uniref:Octanoyltransferase n=1 Tax=Acrodontium crateriforme TaxID=150365 RepID=A0AAQ3R8H5_9PEZI|nr:Hypothetical protein R9X50_00457600 [Acrodontium crateriforme]
MKLRHIHLPGITSYESAAALQDRLVAAFLAHKASPATNAAPLPAVITAQFSPVYTCGRREIGTVSSAQREKLTSSTPWGKAEFYEAKRGGQTTFHGPGQLTAYTVLDLKRHALSPRCHVSLLEQVAIDTCAAFGVKATRTENPGVWIPASETGLDGTISRKAGREEKICALGVHLRRNISSHGLGLNVSTDLGWFDRIVACGLEGLGTTSLEREGVRGIKVEDAGAVFVALLAKALKGVDGAVELSSELD